MKHSKKLLAFLIVLIIPISIGLIQRMAKGVPKRPKLPRFYANVNGFESDYTKTVKDTLWHIVPPFSFTDQNGKTFTEKNLEGNIYVADFVFTSCPGICPLMTQQMKRMQDRLEGKTNNLKFLTHTVDPDRDTPAVLKQYGEKYGANFDQWTFVTGTEEKLYDICRNGYRLGVGPGTEDTEEFDHSGRLVLLDRDRIVRGYYYGTDTNSVNQLMNDILVLQMEYPTKDKFEYKTDNVNVSIESKSKRKTN